MPRPIKKKTVKTRTDAKGEARDFFSDTMEFVELNMKRIVIAAGAVVLVMALAVGYYMYSGGVEKKAEGFLYEGYKYYHGLYDAESLVIIDRMNRALESFKKSLETMESPLALYYMAACYYQLGRYDEAMTALDDLRQKFADEEAIIPLALYKMAMINVQTGKSEEALRTFEELYSYNTKSYKDIALVESAIILEGLGREEEAAEKYRSIAENFPQSPFAGEARIKAGLANATEEVGGEGSETGEKKP
jgi:tetratricopeptide (TPR) repeat protein